MFALLASWRCSSVILILCHDDSCCPPFCLDHDNRIYAGEHTDLSLIPSPSLPTHYQRNKILQLQKMSLRHALVGRKYGLDLARVAVKGPRSLSTRQLSTTSSRQKIIAIKKLLTALPQAKYPVQLRHLCELLQLLSLPGLHSRPQPFHGFCSRTQVCMALSIMYCWDQINA